MSSSSASQNEILNQYFETLKSKIPEVREAGARDLRRYVTAAISDMKSESSEKLWDGHINRRLFDLIHSNHNTDKLGGILAIDHLMEIFQEQTIENRRNLFRFYHYLSPLLPNPDSDVMVAASKSLGKIAKIGGKMDFVDQNIPNAIELLSSTDKTEQHRYAGVLILKELGHNNPMYLKQHVTLIFDKILIPLRDSRVHIREGAAELLAGLLRMLELSHHSPELPFLTKLIEQTLQGLKTNQVEIIHGSLLTYRELLLNAGMAMRDSFQDTVEAIFHYKAHRDVIIRRAVISLIPTIAQYDNQVFSDRFLHKAMAHLLEQLEKPADRTIAYVAIGHVSDVVGSNMKPFLNQVMISIKQALQARGKKGALSEAPILQCLGMLAASVGPNLTKLLHDQLDLIFTCGLSEPLRSALVSIAGHIPPLLTTIQERLLELLSMILTGQTYVASGVPSGAGRADVAKEAPSISQKPEILSLALTTLGTFDFSGHGLAKFAQEAALPYLDDENAEVRKAAALASCRLFVQDSTGYPTNDQAANMVRDALDKLLTVGVASPDPTVRQIVLSSLDGHVEKYLVQPEHIRTIFIALNDEVFSNRVLAIALIGHISKYNPASVIPCLRKALIQLLSELEYSTLTHCREEASRLITLLTSATNRLIKPYSLSILKALLPKITDVNPVVAGQTLLCIGELSAVGGEAFVPHMPQIMSVIISTLGNEAALSKREAALSALGQLCTNTGYVITPTIEHPQLRALLARVLLTKPTVNLRRQIIRVMGILGAVDPCRRKVQLSDDGTQEPPTTGRQASAGPVSRVTTSSVQDDYYQTMVIDVLLGLLKPQSLNNQYHLVVDCIMSILKSQGFKCLSSLPQIIPAFASVTRNSNGRLQEHHLQQVATLIGILKQHIRDYVAQLIELLIELWDTVSLQVSIVSLVEALGNALDAEFRPFLPVILPRLLQVFEGELTDSRTPTRIKVFQAFMTFGSNMEEYVHLIIPVIVKSFERPDGPFLLRETAIVTIEKLSQRVNISSHASRIIHPLLRVLSHQHSGLRMVVMDTLCALGYQLGPDFICFIPSVSTSIIRYQISHDRYERLISTLLNGEHVQPLRLSHETPDHQNTDPSGVPEMAKLITNQQHLKQAWDVSQIITKEDWQDWFQRISTQFMKESPSVAIRSCMNVLDAYPQIAGELFHAAFVSCWGELYHQYQDDLVRSIERALTHTNVPSHLVRILLNLVEFMEREDMRLPIENRTLGECAFQVQAYAKSLHYKELEFHEESTPSVVEALIRVNTKLQQHDAAWGILSVAQGQYDISKRGEWFEQLGRWQEALDAYDAKEKQQPSFDVAVGQMRCLHALCEWDQLYNLANEYWTITGQEEHRRIAPFAAAAAWSMGQWDSMEKYSGAMSTDSLDRYFYRAVIFVHRNQFTKARRQIVEARDLFDPPLSLVIDEDPGGAYKLLVQAQLLSELEEIITYKQSTEQPERQATLRQTWKKRLMGCEPDVEVWHRILQLRTLVMRPEEEPTLWIKFAHLCRENGRMGLAEKTVISLTQPIHTSTKADLHALYSHLKFIWGRGDRDEALIALRNFCETLQLELPIKAGESNASHQERVSELSQVLARCHVKAGQWQAELRSEKSSTSIKPMLESYFAATKFDPKWYKAWHAWSLANLDLIESLETQGVDSPDGVSTTNVIPYVIAAVDGFFRSIALCNDSVLQDILRLFTLWFKFGGDEDVSHAMTSGFTTIAVDTWLEVIPQIIARIQTPAVNIRRTINLVLTQIGMHHPHALIYPLTVASKSTSAARQRAALAIMDRMKDHSATIVEQTMVVSQELIRVAILWHELWHQGLEEASRVYFTEGDPAAMIALLRPLHDMLDKGPNTIHEASFTHVYGRDLQDAREATQRYVQYGETSDLDRAWDIYYGVFRRVENQLTQLNALDLQYVSPELLKARSLELAVPGTYRSDRSIIRISSFASKLTVILSKQRPRRLSIKGDNGQDYQYMLKGHEDLRQDERVMQLYSLVNALLAVDTNSFKRRLHIQRYSVIPLAPNAGLVSWVSESDTLHVLVRDYREARKMLLHHEYRLMLQMAPDYEFLTLLQKVEVFEHALNNTTGQDLSSMLWLRSVNSEAWLNRRATYTRSLAVNSMVGYVLGLGDRHPSNILIVRATGKVVHVDFGDCFEVAMHREKFPETIPFRLTRMLTDAMEVNGIQGSFKTTSEMAMQVMRDNKDSLLAVLEAFVYDPLIIWRFMQADGETRPEGYPQGPTRHVKADEHEIFNGDGIDAMGTKHDMQNERALRVFNRVLNKLTGSDFDSDCVLSIEEQVDRLIREATSIENLCRCFSGWCPLW